VSRLASRVGVGLISYGSREVSIADALLRSQKYKVELYVADRIRNPFNAVHAKEHAVIPTLDTNELCTFFGKHREKIDFIIVGPEDPIIKGVRDLIEDTIGIPVICPTKKYALEGSKAAQRLLLERIMPHVNPRFRIFSPEDYPTIEDVRRELWRWLDELGDQSVVKPDGATRGKGVGVWGDHFRTRDELFEHFLSNYSSGPVIVEEKLVGEESSFMAFCDGNHLVPLPETRDYKRAFDRDEGPNTGGMGSYKDACDWLPFMTKEDWEKEIHIVREIYNRLRGRERNPELIGVPFYTAFMHTSEGPKVLEINSRPGDPEIQNIMPILKDDLVDLCYAMLEGTLTKVEVERKATVVTYKVPPTYGGKEKVYVGDRRVDLSEAEALAEKYGGVLQIYPGALELKNGEYYATSSRTVCAVGIADTIQDARMISLKGINAIKGGNLWNRTDIASEEHIQKSIEHMLSLKRMRK
jgi:phosphoribosylamine--glycine ligase